MKKTTTFCRAFFYILGMVFLACGVTMNTKTGMGVSCILSVPYSISVIWDLNFGNTTLVLYIIFVIVQCILIRRVTVKILLQIPLSIVFTRFMNLFFNIIPDFKGSLAGGFAMLAGAICVTALGIILTVRTDLVPNPGDGIVSVAADAAGISLGLAKNIFDISSVAISCAIGLIVAGHITGVGPGTVTTMIALGRVVALFSHFIDRPLLRACGLEGR